MIRFIVLWKSPASPVIFEADVAATSAASAKCKFAALFPGDIVLAAYAFKKETA